jgi:hypothetical protein
MGRQAQPLLIFRIACFGMAIMAVGLCIASVVALAMRFETNRQPIVVEKIVEKIIEKPVEIILEVPVLPDPRPDLAVMGEINNLPLPPPRDLSLPAIPDPIVEKLVNGARAARFADDIILAINKLDEAATHTPNCPVTLYEMGECYEELKIYDRARESYFKVTSLGPENAGVLYAKASDKLTNGFEQPIDKVNQIVLGKIRVYSDPNATEGQRTVLSIPVQAVPGEIIDYNDIVWHIHPFERIGAKKDIQASQPNTYSFKAQWASNKPDWASGEEMLHYTFNIPPQPVHDAHLFGERKYYGHVVKLLYKGEVIDQQAYPRMLAHRLNIPEESPIAMNQDLPENYNPDNPLLPLNLPPDVDMSPSGLGPPPEDVLPVPEEYRNLPSY